MSKGSESGDFSSVESSDFVLVGRSRESDSKVASIAMDLTGLNPEEVNVVKKIRKIVGENESLKKSLMNHNRLIQEYCDELEKLQKNQRIEKGNMQAIMESLKRENVHLTSLTAGMSYMSVNKSSISDSICFQYMSHVLDLLGKISEKLVKIKSKYETVVKEKSLPYPIQESQDAIDCIKTVSQCFEELKTSIVNENQSLVEGSTKEIHDKNQLINTLKADLSERMKDTENLMALQDKFNQVQDGNFQLTNDVDRLEKIIQQQKNRIEQLECEQPSVEIMQVTSPKQTKMIENLTAELQKANTEIQQLLGEKSVLEGKIRDLNELKAGLVDDTSLQSKSQSLEINEIRNSYDIAMEGLKEEVNTLKENNAGLEDKIKDIFDKAFAVNEENTTLKRTLDLMRKRENKDMDKLNAVTVERDRLSMDLKQHQLTIDELISKMDPSIQEKEREQLKYEQFQMVSDENEKTLNNLQNEVRANEQTIRILREENHKLKEGLAKDVQFCSNCKHTEKNIDRLVQENENLYAKLGGYVSMERRLKEEQAKCEQLSADKQDLAFEMKKVQMEAEMRQKQQRDESESMTTLQQKIEKYEGEIMQYRQALQDYRQRNESLQANQSNTRRDLDNVWANLQTKVNQISKVEEQKSVLSMQVNKLEELLKAEIDKRSQLENYLKTKDAELKKLHDELETVAILREQVRVYESDFNIEREAREKQHGDLLFLRDEVHNLKLENHRLREEVETANKHQMAELQRRYGGGSQMDRTNIGQNVYGLYGRGGTVPDNRRNRVQSNDSLNRSSEMPSQEPDQTVQRLCPKCHTPFPDLDTLQIHVLECIDE